MGFRRSGKTLGLSLACPTYASSIPQVPLHYLLRGQPELERMRALLLPATHKQDTFFYVEFHRIHFGCTTFSLMTT
jgi:hypothetical protein